MPAPRLSQSFRSLLTILELVVRLVLGGTFVYAGILKAREPVVFLEDIRSFHLLPDPYAAWVAMGLPWLEILAGAAVITGVLYAGGLAVLAAALFVFLAALVSAAVRGIDVTCGCFGKTDGASPVTWLVVRDVVMLGAVVWLMIRHGRRLRRK